MAEGHTRQNIEGHVPLCLLCSYAPEFWSVFETLGQRDKSYNMKIWCNDMVEFLVGTSTWWSWHDNTKKISNYLHKIDFRKLECIWIRLHSWFYLWLGFMHSKVAKWHLSTFAIVSARSLCTWDPISMFSDTLDKNLETRWISIT